MIVSFLFALLVVFSQAQARPVCEAGEGARCYYIAPDGRDSAPGTFARPLASIRPILKRLRPGDYVYFRGGEYGADNRGPLIDNWGYSTYSLISTNGLQGAPGRLITFKAYPGERPVIDLYRLNPQFNPTALHGEPVYAISLVGGGYIRIEGFEIIHGAINLNNGAHHVWIENNHIHDLYTFSSNNGLIVLHSSNYVYVYHNRLHDTYERGIPDPDDPHSTCSGTGEGNCILNTVKSHFDPEHNGCLTTLSGDIYVGYGKETTGPIEVKNNEIYDCPSKLFIKNPQGERVDSNGINFLIENNYFHGPGQLFSGLRSSNTLFRNNLCTGNCSVADAGGAVASQTSMINEINGRNIVFSHNIFLDTPYGIKIGGLGFRVDNGVYSDAFEDKMKFENNIVFLREASDPAHLHWNSQGYLFSNHYRGPQADTSPVPSKVFSRIISRNNCIVNRLGDQMCFFKQFITNGTRVTDIIGYTHAEAIKRFNIDGSHDVFPTDMDPAAYFVDPGHHDYTLRPDSPCGSTPAGLIDPHAMQELITTMKARQ